MRIREISGYGADVESCRPSEAESRRMMARGAELLVPGGRAGQAALDLIDVAVPGRGDGRENWHREQHCAVALVRWLLDEQPDLSPVKLLRGDAPDFALSPETATDGILAIEHTDMGRQAYQRTLDAAGALEGPCLIEVSGPDGWIGDEPERAWADDLREAVVRKSDPKCWRAAPYGSARWLLVYDNAATGIVVRDLEARRLVSTALRTERAAAGFDAIALVRGSGSVTLVQRGRAF